MEAATDGEDGRRRMLVAKESDDAKKERENDHDHDDEVNLKKMIASHPLYGLLIESHFNCLKVGLDEIAESDRAKDAGKQIGATSTPPSSPELDHFMEAYCVALRKLKEAIEEPTRETKAFINATYIGLKDLISDDNIESNYDPQDPSHSHSDLDQQSST